MSNRSKGRAFVRAAFVFVTTLAVFVVGVALLHPDSPLPDHWHPFRPLQVSDPVTPLTAWKLDWTASDPELCMATLGKAATIRSLSDKVVDENCGISPRVELAGVNKARLSPLETACPTALRLAMWDEHGVQIAAEAYLDQEVTRISHAGSYSCRPIRTSSGNSNRWSTHSKAMAIDVTAFTLADGSRLTLIDDWDGAPEVQTFFRAIRDSACLWFGTTLSPDYNALHADHFHLQSNGWGTCR